MFTIEEVESCPVTQSAQGVITMTSEFIAMTAGAVRDKIEWIVLLHGGRSTDGYEVDVKYFSVPKQSRGGAHADMKELDLPDDVVGVMHSHHNMGAFFSKTDENELNPRFPSSIVVAVANNNLGFNYQATGKVVLPCGALGVVTFVLSVAGVERFIREPRRGFQHDIEVEDLLGCPRWESEDDVYTRVYRAECGRKEIGEKPLVFGTAGSDTLLSTIQAQTEKPKYNFNFNRNQNHNNNHKNHNQKRTAHNPNKKYGYNMGSSGRVLQGGCDECHAKTVLTWQASDRTWLCRKCEENRKKAKKEIVQPDETPFVFDDRYDDLVGWF